MGKPESGRGLGFKPESTDMDLEFIVPTTEELVHAHKIFEEREPRARDYWLARERTEEGLRESKTGNIAVAIARLLKSWNKDYYRFRPVEAESLVAELQQLIAGRLEILLAFHARSLTGLSDADRATVLELFSLFENKVGSVGAAKALNLLAPDFFPLWDNAIAYQYGVLSVAHGYFLFMVMAEHQVRNLAGKMPDGLALLKTLDEYNYCKYTKGWIA
jgi:hypothetical protein